MLRGVTVSVRSDEKLSACKLWYWSTPALVEAVRARASDTTPGTASGSSLFVRRALAGYLAYVLDGGRVEKEPPRDVGDPRTSATLKCYAHVPHALRALLTTYLRALPSKPNRPWPHSSRKSSVIRQAIRWWIRRNP